jgi:cytochrome c oxidase subunit 3
MSVSVNERVDESAVDSEHVQVETSTGLDSRKIGIWMFIASEVIFFTALISTFLLYRGQTPYSQGLGHLELNVAAVMTFILLMSSFTMVSALAAIRDGNAGRMRLWLIATAVLGLLFLGSQAYEWSLLFREGVLPTTNLFGATFFTTTGFHGSHVFVGVLWMIGVIARASKGGVTAKNNLSVVMVGLYWHFVDLVWVVLFTVIYLI